MKTTHVEMKKRFLQRNDFYKQLENMFIVCLSLFCQLSTQSKMKIIKLCSRCVTVSSSSIHDYNSSGMWDVGRQNNTNTVKFNGNFSGNFRISLKYIVVRIH